MYYPVFINLNGKHCVVVGGDDHAAAKVAGLLEVGAQVTVISEALVSGLDAFYAEGKIRWIDRSYRTDDLEDAFLVISTLVSPAVNRKIRWETGIRNILFNAMDDVPNCNFIAPSVVRQGDLTVAISTSGKAPALAVRLRQQLEKMLGPEYGRFLELAGSLRDDVAERFPDFETRRSRWYELVDSDILDDLKRGDEVTAHQKITDILHAQPETVSAGAEAS